MCLQPETRTWMQDSILPYKSLVPTPLIVISGKRYCGKTTAAMMLVEENFSLFSVADELKRGYAEFIGIDLAALYDHRKETYRKDMIKWAKENRLNSPDCFLRAWVNSCIGKDRVACDDERFPNEFEAMNLLGAHQVRIKADDEVRISLGWHYDEWIDTDDSETGLDHIPDDWFRENGSLIDNPGIGYRDIFEAEILKFAKSVSEKI